MLTRRDWRSPRDCHHRRKGEESGDGEKKWERKWVREMQFQFFEKIFTKKEIVVERNGSERKRCRDLEFERGSEREKQGLGL
ncbi:hypothetical protein FH972_002282 [Carpinus fangiana]|uniref:Uncharacterized protein n=1 Tax=Carpinus fangiana TaxID=176857 RepID=A0A5N6QEQ8_9ROSI|nr:hypothetical protein FH972_002282 [Carpinus fangiana]